jgi:hypothetical protein
VLASVMLESSQPVWSFGSATVDGLYTLIQVYLFSSPVSSSPQPFPLVSQRPSAILDSFLLPYASLISSRCINLIPSLVKSASYILLQGVPSHVSLDAVRSSIKSIPGVVSVHELHVWQLSESTIVASVHVLIRPGMDYMEVASAIREGMHSHGIHSVTIQPEWVSSLPSLH